MAESNSQPLFQDIFPGSLSQPSQQLLPNYSQTIDHTHKASFDLSSCHILITHYEADSEQSRSRELLQNFDLGSVTNFHSFRLHSLLQKIEEDANYQLQNCQVMLYLPTGDLYITFGVHPLTTDISLSLEEYIDGQSQTLKLKTKRVPWSAINLQMMQNTSRLLLDGPPKKFREGKSSQVEKKNKIKNFQKVGYIVKKVLALKQQKNKSQMAKEGYSLRNAQSMTKKSLEDYYYQIRMGFKYGYDFNQNCQKNMTHLRQFNRRVPKQPQVSLENFNEQ